MEKNSDILFLGDRRAGEIAPILEKKFAGRYDPARYQIRCRQLVDEQSTAALAEAAKTALAGATTAVIATGLGDLARGIPAEEYEGTLLALCQMVKDAGAMGVLLTMPPQKGAKAYNAALRRVAEHFQMRIADVHGRWRHDFGRKAVSPEQAAQLTAAVARAAHRAHADAGALAVQRQICSLQLFLPVLLCRHKRQQRDALPVRYGEMGAGFQPAF